MIYPHPLLRAKLYFSPPPGRSNEHVRRKRYRAEHVLLVSIKFKNHRERERERERVREQLNQGRLCRLRLLLPPSSSSTSPVVCALRSFAAIVRLAYSSFFLLCFSLLNLLFPSPFCPIEASRWSMFAMSSPLLRFVSQCPCFLALPPILSWFYFSSPTFTSFVVVLSVTSFENAPRVLDEIRGRRTLQF
ncbi:uncharacterized protein LOC129302824 [Prosopis cineraria]|uniref:uncharacterized protein LOC129302824 n=1 Tax=Prosopis cineraria TaxID=364024 RepID=UPI00240F2CA3|nr:uncharacterized protein LOC129302824 [Prosopis cineraria]